MNALERLRQARRLVCYGEWGVCQRNYGDYVALAGCRGPGCACFRRDLAKPVIRRADSARRRHTSEEAWARAADRIRQLRLDIERLVETPYIGTSRPDIHFGIRFLRRDGAVIWFLPAEERQTITVAAIFFGGQDHIRHMLARMLQG